MDRHGLRPRDDDSERPRDDDSERPRDDEEWGPCEGERLSLRAKRGNPCRHEVMDRHGLRPRDDDSERPRDEVRERPRDDNDRPCDDEEWGPCEGERLSLRAKRGNPCRHEVMDRHGLRPRDDEVRGRPPDDSDRPRDEVRERPRDDDMRCIEFTKRILLPLQ